MIDYRYEIRVLIDPEQTELLPHGSLLQHVSVIMTDPPREDDHGSPWLPPAAVTLRPQRPVCSPGSCLSSPTKPSA